jgi:hypothetical protein
LCKHKTAWDAHDFVRALFDEVFIFDIYRNKELSRSVLTLAVSAHTKKAQKPVWKDGPLTNRFQEPPMRIAAQDDNHDGRIRPKNFL